MVRSRRYPTESITDTGIVNYITLLTNTHTQAETLPHSLEQAAVGIGFHANVHKTEYVSLKRGDISTLNDGPLKLIDNFTNLGSSEDLDYTKTMLIYT